MTWSLTPTFWYVGLSGPREQSCKPWRGCRRLRRSRVRQQHRLRSKIRGPEFASCDAPVVGAIGRFGRQRHRRPCRAGRGLSRGGFALTALPLARRICQFAPRRPDCGPSVWRATVRGSIDRALRKTSRDLSARWPRACSSRRLVGGVPSARRRVGRLRRRCCGG